MANRKRRMLALWLKSEIIKHRKTKVDSFVTALYCHIVTDMQGYLCREDKGVR